MKLVAADWLPYQLAFKRPWQTSRGVMTQRDGRLLRLRTADGLVGWGDAAPLPEFGISAAAAQEFAEECAYLDLTAQRQGVSLAQYLSGEPAPQSITVNAVLGSIFSVKPADIPAGYQTLKLKVGIGSVTEEIRQLQALSAALPAGCRWRLDANAAWSLADARFFIAACRNLPIEGLEEPLAQPSHEQLRALQQDASFPLAIDESTHLLDDAFWHSPPVARLIIKPARCGGLLVSVALALRARAAGLEVVVTSSLESACGLLAFAHLAAAVAPMSTHGLASGGWFVTDTGAGPQILADQLMLPKAPGLGFICEISAAP